MVGPNGEQVGIVRVEDALRLAQEADLDLVEVAPDARPPVCKLMDFGKYKYEADMKAREARRNQANTVLKEIRFRLKIDPHDYETKKGHVLRFLRAGDKVKVMIMFRGREQSRPEMGVRLLQRLAADVVEDGTIESMPRQDGRNMIMVLGPTRKKAEVRGTQRRRTRRSDEDQHSDHGHDEAFEAESNDDEVLAEQSTDAPETVASPDPEPTASVEPEPKPAAKPASEKPAVAKPAAAKPAADKPASAKPATAKPAAAKPTAAKPAAPKPVARPRAPKSTS